MGAAGVPQNPGYPQSCPGQGQCHLPLGPADVAITSVLCGMSTAPSPHGGCTPAHPAQRESHPLRTQHHPKEEEEGMKWTKILSKAPGCWRWDVGEKC